MTAAPQMLTAASRLIQVLAGDPSLRGVIQALQFGLLGVQGGRINLDAMTWPMKLAADTLEQVNAGKPASFSWKDLVQGSAARPDQLLRFLTIQTALDYSALEPGLRASNAIRQAASDLDFAGKYQARLRLTGPVPLEDEEFATIKENAGLNATVTIAVVLFILWMALRWWRIIAAVFINLAVGLSINAAVGLPGGRHAQSDVSLFRGAVRWSGCRLRYSVQRALSRGAARYRRFARSARPHAGVIAAQGRRSRSPHLRPPPVSCRSRRRPTRACRSSG